MPNPATAIEYLADGIVGVAGRGSTISGVQPEGVKGTPRFGLDVQFDRDQTEER
jgi:hypothetical protein